MRLIKLLLAIGIAATIAGSSKADEVNIYSYRQPDLIQPLLDRFTAKTGIDTRVVFLNKGMVERLKLEDSRSPADVILTVDISRLQNLVNEGVVQRVENDAINERIPANFRDPDGEWFALTLRARVIYASKDRVASGSIVNYESLAEPEWQGRVCTRSGTHPYNLALTSAMIIHKGENATRNWLEGVKSNLARKPQGNDRAQVKAIWAGECDVSLGNTYYMGLMLSDAEQSEWASTVRIVFPEFADGGTHVNVSGMALAKYSPNKQNAITLMEFLASDEAQEIYAQVNHEYPVNPDVGISDIVSSWGTFERDNLDLESIGKFRGPALKMVTELDFDG